MSVRLACVALATSGVLVAVACGSSDAGFGGGAGANGGSAEGGAKAGSGGAGANSTGGRAAGGAPLGGAGASNSGAGGAGAAGAGGGDLGGEGQGDGGAGAAAGGGANLGGNNGGTKAVGGGGSGGGSSGGASGGGGQGGGSTGGAGGAGAGGKSSGGGGSSGGSSAGAGGLAGSAGEGGAQAVECGTGPGCASGEVCLQIVVTAGPTETTTYRCAANPCGNQTLACSCAGNTCGDANPASVCSLAEPAISRLRCSAGGVCVAPDTPIATPDGDCPIAALRAGDLVYSVDDNRFVAVPLLRASRTAVTDHVVVHLETERGARLYVSAPHPTADGRTFADLKVGDRLDGATIVVREMVAYTYDATYDILPASSTGAYVASGLLIGSTLK